MAKSTTDIVFTDLDGTLLNSQSECSSKDYETLVSLKSKNIIRVAATGRSLYSAHKVLSPEFPIDYLIFSSGAGIMDWQHKKILLSRKLISEQVISISNTLKENNVDFMLHYPIPENHHFVYYSTGKENADFERRIEIYKAFAEPMFLSVETFGAACQFIAIIPNDVDLYNRIAQQFPDVKVIRATSPLDHKSIWIEIFPTTVSKGLAAKWLCEYLQIGSLTSLSLGNDYNDIDMLNFTASSFVVENAPEDLKNKYPVCGHHNKSGFSEVIGKIGE
ncbi:HAD-IIB family hydrolase [Candidatus Venteria ishoeyi]|uniref:Putative phosphatase MPN_427 n=1 Tax=Candidatus Venteria ishoeyi TaxID=1899563 RepID=A0A1H6F5L9_9GAMM|nr:HAD-IIB family hydrolase [Candidatus Venteria ishoeyi]SEH05430.1 Putative phosphatase MPN_427 [Candidatus Venteria ishoeyi]